MFEWQECILCIMYILAVVMFITVTRTTMPASSQIVQWLTTFCEKLACNGNLYWLPLNKRLSSLNYSCYLQYFEDRSCKSHKKCYQHFCSYSLHLLLPKLNWNPLFFLLHFWDALIRFCFGWKESVRFQSCCDVDKILMKCHCVDVWHVDISQQITAR